MIRDEPVMVCETCGCGFLVNPGSKIHPTPAWFTSFSEADGACLGRILMKSRRFLAQQIINKEKNIAAGLIQDR